MALAKFAKLIEIIKVNGGLRKSLYKLFIHDDLKDGRVVGRDNWGNTYYENNRYFMPRNRWVEYNPNYRLEYDASQISAEWFGWMHNRTDLLPCENTEMKSYKWMLPHTENMTGTSYAYYPYSTTIPKVTAWNPKQAVNQSKDSAGDETC